MRIAIFHLLLVLPSLLAAAGQRQPAGALPERFEHKEHGYIVRYPSNYEVMDGADAQTKVFSSPAEDELDVFRENLAVMVRSYDREVPLEEARTALKKEMEAKAATLTEESDKVKLGGLAAHRCTWSLKLGGFDLVLVQLVTTVRDRVYVVTFTFEAGHEARHQPVARAMVDAFEITYK
jgi:hypothetical protein